jgi:hypothetical protein
MKYSYEWTKLTNTKKESIEEICQGSVWYTDLDTAIAATDFYWSMLSHAPSIIEMRVVDETGKVYKTCR